MTFMQTAHGGYKGDAVTTVDRGEDTPQLGGCGCDIHVDTTEKRLFLFFLACPRKKQRKAPARYLRISSAVASRWVQNKTRILYLSILIRICFGAATSGEKELLRIIC
jgi:hypothetical protein